MIRDEGGGYVELQGPGGLLNTIQPFGSSWTGPFAMTEVPDEFWIGAGRGGGPRFQRRSRFLPGYPQTAGDVFLADPNDRSGVVFPGAAVVCGPLTFYPEAKFRFFLQLENPYPGAWAGDVVYLVAQILAGLGIQVANRRPDDFPGFYLEGVVGLKTTWLKAAGTTFAYYPKAKNPWTPLTVVFTGSNDPGAAAVGICHELGHFFLGPDHTAIAGNIMVPSPGPSARFNTAQKDTIRSLAVAF